MINDKKYIFLICFSIFSIYTFSQTVNGVVRDKDQIPVAGVNVQVKNGKTGSTSNFDGEYEIREVRENDTLVFSFIGFKTVEEPVESRGRIDIILEEYSESLDEVVLVGAKFSKGDLTGAVENVDASTLEERPVTSINEALQGKVSGVFIQNDPSPGGKAGIRIRGHNSMHYGGNPIYVVDGIVMDGDFELINIDDVSSVQVLKDASATALYGSRGANGVIVVSTKKGERGEGKISYKTWVGVQEYTRNNITMNGKDIFELRLDAFQNSHVARDYFQEHPGASQEDFLSDELLSENSNWFAQYEIDAYNAEKSYNWLEKVSRTALQQNHHLSFSGASESNSYYLSFGYKDQEGLIKNSSNKRYNGRINVEQKIKPWIKIGTNTSYTLSKDEEVDGAVFSVARDANPLLPIDRYKDTLFLAWGNNWDINRENPFNTLKIDKDRKRTEIASSNYLEITPVDNLNLRSTFAVTQKKSEYYEYIPSDIQQARRDSYIGRAVHNLDHSFYYQWDNSLTYKTKFQRHSLDGLFSFSMSKEKFDYTNVLARDFPTDDLRYYNLGGAFDKENFQLGSDFSASTLQSFLGRINYNYDQRYFLTLSGRFDGSSRFSKGNKWGFFPSLAASWNITNERFMQSQRTLDLLKLRIGYGSVGNQGIPNYAFYSLYNPVYNNGKASFVSTGTRGTYNLGWEKQKQLNVGLDIALLNNRINLTVDYFDIVNSNLLMSRDLSKISGYSNAIENVGEIKNKGIEFGLNGTIVRSADFSWDLAATFSVDKNRITKLYGDREALYSTGGFTGTDIQRTGNFFLGHSLNTIYTMEFDRIIQEEDMDYVNSLDLPGKQLHPGDILPKDQQSEGEDGYGVIDSKDKIIVGKQDPKFYGGFSTGISWEQISLNSVFTYSYGAKKISGFYESLMAGTGMGPAHKDMKNRWTPENINTNIPRATYDNAQRFGAGETSWGIQDASYLRLSTVTLSYSFSPKVLSKLGLSSLRLYTSGNNLYTWTKYGGYDPENGDWYPTARMYVFGIDLSL